MNSARVIIGSGFGDEGKGLATDFHAAPHGQEALVVRFNGGAQAGHTVVAPDGRRHVFSHVGSGSFTGAATYLSRFFICHPMLLRDEVESLRMKGVTPRIFVDRDCPITTPFDVMINQAIEMARGKDAHGSCGLGFGETIEREERGGFELHAIHTSDPAWTAVRLRQIRDHYLPSRLAALGIDSLPPAASDDVLIDRFVEDTVAFARSVEFTDHRILERGYRLVFEGAQGLLLDMDRGDFPHVTRSSTGLANVLTLARDASIEHLDVSYVSRIYATRHGAGPMRHELDRPPISGIGDRTNRTNAWQGSLRYGWLDVDRITRAVGLDLGDASAFEIDVDHEWILTWADWMDEGSRFVVDGQMRNAGGGELGAALTGRTGASGLRLCFGETREGVMNARAHGDPEPRPATPGATGLARHGQPLAPRPTGNAVFS